MAFELSVEFAKVVVQTMKITEATYDQKTDEYGIDWEDAFTQTGADPQLKPFVLAVLESGRPDIRSWLSQQVSVAI